MSAPAAAAANPFAPRTYGQLEPLTEHVYLWRNIVNSTIVVGHSELAVIDTQVNQALARRLVQALSTAFPAHRIAYAINTHYHWDHTNGNAVFAAAGATLVASRRTAAAMVERAPRQKAFLSGRGFTLGPDPTLPQVFSDDVPRLDLGGISLELRPGCRAETADPTLIWCPEDAVLCAGDTVMTGSFPIFGQPSQDEGLQDAAWLAALDEVEAFAPRWVAPGHGPQAGAADLALLRRICTYFLDVVATHHRAGRSLAETIAVMEEDMPAWITRIPEVWGTPRYAILRVWAGLEALGEPGWQHRKPSAIPAPRRPADRLPASSPLDAWQSAIHGALEGGDPGQAAALAAAACAAHPDDPAAWTLQAATMIAISRGIASVLEKGDCFAAAGRSLERALQLDPAHPGALIQAGQYQVMMAFRNGDDPGPGEAMLERAAASPGLTSRQQAEIAFYLGMGRRTLGDEAGAAACFARALQADRTYMPALMVSMR
jgi:glyoxylase-like metal-dependent hydrolase (beta-lactamase superfamily II)